MNKFRNVLFALVLLMAIALVGCNGGGGGDGDVSVPNEISASAVNGVYQGTSYNATANVTQDTVGLIYNGEVYFLIPDDNQLSIGTATVWDDNSVTARLDTIQIGTGYLGTAQINADYVKEAWIKGTFAYPDLGQNGSFDLTIAPSWFRPASLDTIAGVYVGPDAYGDTVTLTVQPDGVLFGQDTFGCAYDGSVIPAQADRNIYDLKVTVSNCGNGDGDYNGYVTLSDGTYFNELFTYVMLSDKFIILGTLNRQ